MMHQSHKGKDEPDVGHSLSDNISLRHKGMIFVCFHLSFFPRGSIGSTHASMVSLVYTGLFGCTIVKDLIEKDLIQEALI